MGPSQANKEQIVYISREGAIKGTHLIGRLSTTGHTTGRVTDENDAEHKRVNPASSGALLPQTRGCVY